MIALRTITADDWRAWRELRLEALREAPYAYGSTLDQWQGDGDTEERWRERLTGVPFNLIAYLDERAAGIASGTHRDDNGAVDAIVTWAREQNDYALALYRRHGFAGDGTIPDGERSLTLSIGA